MGLQQSLSNFVGSATNTLWLYQQSSASFLQRAQEAPAAAPLAFHEQLQREINLWLKDAV